MKRAGLGAGLFCIYTLIILIGIGLSGKAVLTYPADRLSAVWTMGAPRLSYTAGETTGHLPCAGEQYGELICESAGLRVPLYYGDSEEELKKGAGTYIGGSLPGNQGTILIGGHDTTYFAGLEKLQEADQIQIETSYGSFSYTVKKMETAQVKDLSWENLEEKEQLVLYTCYPFGVSSEERSERYLVYAE